MDHRFVFPLRTVFFPGTRMPLRIFEQRYLRMVSACMQGEQAFVISLIKGEYREAGDSAECFALGTQAKIVDFDKGADGILDIIVEAGERVQISNSVYDADQLMHADSDVFSEPILDEFPEKYVGLKKLFAGVVEQNPKLKSQFILSEGDLSATQISFLLSYIAPVSLRKKQQLLALDGTQSRLAMLEKFFSDMRYTMIA